jgi:hypothetical protein
VVSVTDLDFRMLSTDTLPQNCSARTRRLSLSLCRRAVHSATLEHWSWRREPINWLVDRSRFLSAGHHSAKVPGSKAE